MADIEKDVTSTTFGLVIAFLLPGLAGFYTLSFFSAGVSQIFGVFLTQEANIGLFILVALASISIGLSLTAVRYFLFERLLCRQIKLNKLDFSSLRDINILLAFRACVDEHYRYHQFWGGVSIVIPLLFWGMLAKYTLTPIEIIWLMVSAILCELFFVKAAIKAFEYYVERSNNILQSRSVICPTGGTEKN